MGATGSRRGIVPLVEQHYQSLYRYAYRLSGAAADAEDLTQEAFCKAQAQLTTLRDPERSRPWLFAILRNAYLHRARSDRAHKQVSLEMVGDLPAQPSAEMLDVDPEQLQGALNDLPEGFRTPVILFYFEDMSYRDIAEQMNLPIGTVMSRLARAKSHLRERLVLVADRPSGSGGEVTRGL
ncbi:MAG TPA: sigma-70 family RNA polymerase sigma factor [Gemmataceae bacterium]|jgi:RNA polymerase sigma-70 factor (ECF subfamily)|nr:sigma-70 family RNA polymerase sigma factor [Gemmataceae bacterium]